MDSEPTERLERAAAELHDTLRLAPGSAEQLGAAAGAWGAAFQAAVAGAMNAWVTSFAEALFPAIERMLAVWDAMRREWLAAWLMRHHVPERPARWIAAHWPRRWLDRAPMWSPDDRPPDDESGE